MRQQKQYFSFHKASFFVITYNMIVPSAYMYNNDTVL